MLKIYDLSGGGGGGGRDVLKYTVECKYSGGALETFSSLVLQKMNEGNFDQSNDYCSPFCV